MDKTVVTRKPHKCEFCECEIPKGSKAFYMEGRNPVYEPDRDDAIHGFNGKQVGIEYFKWYYCFGSDGDNMPACYND